MERVPIELQDLWKENWLNSSELEDETPLLWCPPKAVIEGLAGSFLIEEAEKKPLDSRLMKLSSANCTELDWSLYRYPARFESFQKSNPISNGVMCKASIHLQNKHLHTKIREFVPCRVFYGNIWILIVGSKNICIREEPKIYDFFAPPARIYL